MDTLTMFKENENLIHSIIRERYPHLIGTFEYDDAFQEGSIGLLKAIKDFDPSMGYEFSTYAYPAIQRTIYRGIYPFNSNMKVSRIANETHIEFKHYMENGYNFDEIVEKLNIKPSTLLNVVNAYSGDHLEREILEQKSGSNIMVMDTVQDDFNLENNIIVKEETKIANTLCKIFLSKEDNFILNNYYSGVTQVKLCKIVGKTQATVSKRVVKIENTIFPLFRDYIEGNIMFGDLCTKLLERERRAEKIKLAIKSYLDYVLESIIRENYQKKFLDDLGLEINNWDMDIFIMVMEFLIAEKHYLYQVNEYLFNLLKVVDKYFSRNGIESIVYDILVASEKGINNSHMDSLLKQII